MNFTLDMSREAIARHSAEIDRRMTTVPAAVQGYARFLREDAQRTEANASAVRAHNAKAQTVAAANARRRAGLIATRDVIELVEEIAGIAIARISLAPVPASVTPRKRPFAAAVKARGIPRGMAYQLRDRGLS